MDLAEMIVKRCNGYGALATDSEAPHFGNFRMCQASRVDAEYLNGAKHCKGVSAATPADAGEELNEIASPL